MFAITPREQDLCYQIVEPVWDGSKRFSALSITKLVLFSYMTDLAQSGNGLVRDLVQKVAEGEYNVASLGRVLRGAR